jgi:hypothetical protein
MTSPQDTEPPTWLQQLVYVVRPIHKHKKSKTHTAKTTHPRTRKPHTSSAHTHTKSPKKSHYPKSPGPKKSHLSSGKLRKAAGTHKTSSKHKSTTAKKSKATTSAKHSGRHKSAQAVDPGTVTAGTYRSIDPATGESTGLGINQPGYPSTTPGDTPAQLAAQWKQDAKQAYYGARNNAGFVVSYNPAISYPDVPGLATPITTNPWEAATTATTSTSDTKTSKAGHVAKAGHAALGISSPVYHPPAPPLIPPTEWRTHAHSSRHL